MMKFEKTTDDRKVLVKRLEELSGQKAVYTFMPRCAYVVGFYTVERDGSLTVDENAADTSLLNTLREEGLIAGDIPTNDVYTETEETEPIEALSDAAPESETQEAESQDYEEHLSGNGEDEPEVMSIGFPIAQHTGNSLRSLIRLLYSRGAMINKSIGTKFYVDKGLITALEDDSCADSTLSLRIAVSDYEKEHRNCIFGIQMSDDEVILTGFPATQDTDRLKAYTELTELMNRMAIKQQRIQAKEIVTDNEKYAFRIWLLRLGMNGAEYKRTRKILLTNLNGNSAFRTKADEERFKEREKQKRDALKAAAASQETAETAQEETEGEDQNG